MKWGGGAHGVAKQLTLKTIIPRKERAKNRAQYSNFSCLLNRNLGLLYMSVSMAQTGDFSDFSANSRPVFMKRLFHDKMILRVYIR